MGCTFVGSQLGMKKKQKRIAQDVPARTVPEPKAISSGSSKNEHLILFLLLAVTLLFFSPSLKSGFVNWDDDRNVYENPLVKEFDVKGIFTQNVIGNYNPLSILSFALEYKLFGMDPGKMHLTNLLLHLFCVTLVYFIFKRLSLESWYAWMATALFALHPLRVESVTWITERKDVLYGLFFCLALLLYLKNHDVPSKKRSLLIYVLFVVGLFAKIQMVALPLTFLTVDYWNQKTMNIKRLVEKWHFFLTALIFGIVGILFLKEQGSLETNDAVHTGLSRIFIGSYSLMIYLIKWLIPFRMSPLYPYPESLDVLHYVSLPAVLLVFYGVWYAYRYNQRWLVFGFMFFFFNIMFLLQILGAGQGYLADRFTYIAYMGLFFLLAYGLQFWTQHQSQNKSIILACFPFYLGFLSFQTYQQTKIWHDSESLWTHVLNYYKNTPLPYNNRANHYRDQKRFDLALADYSQAIKYKAGHGTYNSRAKLYFQKNEDEKALLDYDKAISLHPSAEYYVNRGAAKAKLGRTEEAFEDINKGLSLDKNWKTGYLNRSILYNQKGDFQNAAADIDRYLKFDSGNADMWYEGGRCYRAIKEYERAIQYYTKAIQLKPNVGLFYLERGRTFQTIGQNVQADQDLQKAGKLGEKIY